MIDFITAINLLFFHMDLNSKPGHFREMTFPDVRSHDIPLALQLLDFQKRHLAITKSGLWNFPPLALKKVKKNKQSNVSAPW